jgi:hypothetical protein
MREENNHLPGWGVGLILPRQTWILLALHKLASGYSHPWTYNRIFLLSQYREWSSYDRIWFSGPNNQEILILILVQRYKGYRGNGQLC